MAVGSADVGVDEEEEDELLFDELLLFDEDEVDELELLDEEPVRVWMLVTTWVWVWPFESVPTDVLSDVDTWLPED